MTGISFRTIIHDLGRHYEKHFSFSSDEDSMGQVQDGINLFHSYSSVIHRANEWEEISEWEETSSCIHSQII